MIKDIRAIAALRTALIILAVVLSALVTSLAVSIGGISVIGYGIGVIMLWLVVSLIYDVVLSQLHNERELKESVARMNESADNLSK
jgi:fatty acid desaturase